MIVGSNRFEGITGSAIRRIFAYLSDPEMISLAGGNPAPETFPSRQLADLASALLVENGDWVLQYGGTRGVNALLQYLSEMNADLMTDDDDVITLTGSSQGIDLYARSMLDDGDTVLVEAPSFLGAIQTFRLSNAAVQAVPMEDDGVDLDALKKAIRKYRPKFFYTIPTFQNPSGITTSDEKRRRIYEICAENDVAILEDDPYGELRFDGEQIDPIKAHDDGRVVTRLRSFSKTISPGLRVGYATGPREVIRRFELLKQGADVHTPNLNQQLVLAYLKSGAYDERVAENIALYRDHRDAMLETLDEYAPDGMTYTRPEGGFFLWVQLPNGLNAQELFEESAKQKVVFVPGTSFYPDGGHENTMRLNFSMPTSEQIREGTKRLCGVIAKKAAEA